MFDAVSTIIPRASKPHHIESNAKTSSLPPLTKHEMDQVQKIYDEMIKNQVHHLW